ncbi:MAG: LPS export ABC transporter periplasmic protein LptC [Bacteroides sp.]|nr:LPS export ABC transporter periplasmic protein LptC [Bacteroides sp.]
MLRQRSNNLFSKHNNGITTTFWVVVMLLFFSACGSKKKDLGDAITERDSLPAMSTYGVTTLVSDSGITRYRVEAEEWLVFDKKNPSFWSFEKGLYLEKFDSIFNIDASVKADTAYYFDQQKLWKLIKNVEIQNLKGDMLFTDLLYWNEKEERIYSDQYVRIEQEDQIIWGTGFESDQNLFSPRIFNIQGIFDVTESDREPPSFTSDPLSITTDSISPSVSPVDTIP